MSMGRRERQLELNRAINIRAGACGDRAKPVDLVRVDAVVAPQPTVPSRRARERTDEARSAGQREKQTISNDPNPRITLTAQVHDHVGVDLTNASDELHDGPRVA